MKKAHPGDYQKYGKNIKLILAQPDYVGLNPKDNSIEYVKEFMIENEYDFEFMDEDLIQTKFQNINDLSEYILKRKAES